MVEANADFTYLNLTGVKHSYTNPKADEWNTLMSSFQQKVPESKPEMWWSPIRLVFDSQWF